MEEMVEPDRTIMIVSIIGIVIIWGSFFYHKFVQGGSTASGHSDSGPEGDVEQPTPEGIAAAGEGNTGAVEKPARADNRKKGKRRKKR